MMKADPVEAKRRFRLTLEERTDREMAEKTLYQRVRYRAKKTPTTKVVHFTQAMVGGTTEEGAVWATPVGGDSKGFPDLVLYVAGKPTAYRELKKELGKLSPEQEEWRDLLLARGEDWAIWRPSDLRLGVIDRFFRGA